jgi:hypothetical protein
MPDTLTTNTLDEINTFPILLNDHWRVVDNPLQWILQYRAGNISHSDESENRRAWAGKHYCRTRAALKMRIQECCSEVDPIASAVVASWPVWHV